MKIYLAPMEGLTGYIYRNAYYEVFGYGDKYFTPFVSNRKLNAREKKDVDPDNNRYIKVVPQILTNKADDFIYIAGQFKNMGYDTVNLNLGCPSGTVVAKHRGAGFLELLPELEEFLDEIFNKCDVKISVKTRIGKELPGECEDIIKLYNKFPLEELIIHPRLQTDFYNGTPRLEQFGEALSISCHKVCYNGDINTVEDYNKILERFPGIDSVMIGRGVLSDPGLIGEIQNGRKTDIKDVKRLHDIVYEGYKNTMPGSKPALCKMKELWWYMGRHFTDSAKLIKKIKKCETFEKYDMMIEEIFNGEYYRWI